MAAPWENSMASDTALSWIQAHYTLRTARLTSGCKLSAFLVESANGDDATRKGTS